MFWIDLFSHSFLPPSCFGSHIIVVIAEIKTYIKSVWDQTGQYWNQSWIFIERTDAEAEAPIVWLSDAKSQLIRKDNEAGKDWRQ